MTIFFSSSYIFSTGLLKKLENISGVAELFKYFSTDFNSVFSSKFITSLTFHSFSVLLFCFFVIIHTVGIVISLSYYYDILMWSVKVALTYYMPTLSPSV